MNNQQYNRFEINTERKRKRENTVRGFLLHKAGLIFKIFFGIFLMFLGIWMILFDGDMEYVYETIDEILAIGLTYMLYYFFIKARYPTPFKKWLVTILSFLVIVRAVGFFGDYAIIGLKNITAIFGLITGGILFLNFLRQVRDHVSFWYSLIWSVIYILVGIILLFYRKSTVDFSGFVGFYIMTFAFNFTRESVKSFFTLTNKRREKKRKVVTLPTVISAFLPIGFFSNLNSTVSRDDVDKTLFLEDEDEGEKTDLTIFIHTRAGLVPGFGHVDISFDNQVYCYGNYDESTWIMGGFISDGVLATTTPENHLKNALTNDKKVIIAYDLRITEKTKNKIKKQIEKMMEKAYRWKPDAELASEGLIEGAPEDYTDVASKMFLESQTKLYKFKKGSPYKTYYLLGQNCAMVANEIVGHSGIKLLRLNRIVTPGSYLEYLDQLYKMGHTIVVDRNIYMLNDNGKPYLLPPEDEKHLEEVIK